MTARQLAQWQQELGSELESKWPLQDQTGTGLRLRGPLEVDISLDKEIDIQSADWAVRAVSQMQVQFRLAAGGRGAGMQTLAVSPEAVLKAWERGDRVVTLGAEVGGGFATIPTQWMDAHGDRLRRILAVRRQKLPQQEHGGRNENEGRRSAEFLDESSAESLKIDMLALAFEAGSPDTVLTTLSKFMSTGPESRPNNHADNQRYNQLSNVVLRPYQAEGVRWLAARKAAGLGALLADDMGLGKTLQALATITGPTLVVAPTSMLRTWVSEAARFRPDLELNLYHGPLRNLGPQASPVDSAPVDSAPVDSVDAAARVRPSLTVTSYGVLRLDEEKLAAQHWHTVILDEAQNIRNADSQSARAARRLKADFRLALTGTPVENRAEDLWSLFQFILPGWLGSRQDALQTIQSQRQRKARLLPFILRRLKKDVAPELPPKTEQVITVELNEEERATYTAIQVATKAQALKYLSETNGEKVSPLGILEALLRLRQACCDPKLVLPPPGGIGARTASSKTKALLDQLESLTAEGHRALVFSQWTSYLDLIQGACAFKNIKTARLDGSTSVTKRAQLVDEFQNNPSSPPVMLMSLKAGGVGLTLTAADHVFIMDPWWNPAAEDQAADRAHRMGQNKPVFVYRMVAADTLEEAVIALQNKKRRLAEAALSGTDSEFTTDDLKAIIDSL
jgi:SNF2 family DNA or RNA helicase